MSNTTADQTVLRRTGFRFQPSCFFYLDTRDAISLGQKTERPLFRPVAEEPLHLPVSDSRPLHMVTAMEYAGNDRGL